MKKSREEIAFEYFKQAGPALISFEQKDEGPTQILLNGTGQAFWLNADNGPETPYITLEEVLSEAKHLLLVMFTADADTELDEAKLVKFEGDLRRTLKKGELSAVEVRDVKIKFLDLKEELLDTPAV